MASAAARGWPRLCGSPTAGSRWSGR